MGATSAGVIQLQMILNSEEFKKQVEHVNNRATSLAERISVSFKKSASSATQSFSKTKTSVGKSLSEIAKENGKTVNQIRSEVAKIAAEYKKQGMNASEAMKKAYADIGYSVGSATDKATKKVTNNLPNSIEASCSKISSSLKKVGAAIVAAFSVAAIKKFGQECIESAASVQAAGSQFEQTFGDMQSQAESAMKSVADTSGIVQSRLQGVGTSIYAFAKTTGMESAQALTMMQEALQVTADSAAYYDRSLEDTAESLKSFLKGNFENDAALGLSCTETTRNTAANKLYGKSFKDLSESQKQLTLLQMVKDANKLSGAMGQASRESEGWENVTGNLKETWNQFLAVVGKPILQGAVTVIQKITSAIQKLTEYAKTAVSALSDLFGWETNESVANTNAVAKNISESTENQEELTVATAKTNEVAKRGVASFDKLNVISQSNSGDSGDSDSSTNATSSDAGLTNLSNAKLNESVDGFKQKFDKFFEPIKKSWEKYGKPVFDKFKQTINKIKTATEI